MIPGYRSPVRILLFLPVVSCIFLLCASCQDADRTEGSRNTGDRGPAGPGEASTVLQLFQDSWERDDLDALMDLLSERSRVIMNVDLLDFDGEYGRGQARYIMKEFFERAERKQFYLSRYRELSGGRSAYAAGEITYRDRKTGIELELMIFLSLEERSDTWMIEEIRINER